MSVPLRPASMRRLRGSPAELRDCPGTAPMLGYFMSPMIIKEFDIGRPRGLVEVSLGACAAAVAVAAAVVAVAAAVRCRASSGAGPAGDAGVERYPIDPATVEDITINGFPGATAAAKGDQWDFRLYALRYGSDVYRFIFAAKHRTVDSDRAFRESDRKSVV